MMAKSSNQGAITRCSPAAVYTLNRGRHRCRLPALTRWSELKSKVVWMTIWSGAQPYIIKMLSPQEVSMIALAQPTRAVAYKDQRLDLTGASSEILQSSARPEALLLVACARNYLDSETTQQINILLRGEPDWDNVCRKAHQHGVTPLLYRSLSSCQKDAVPE